MLTVFKEIKMCGANKKFERITIFENYLIKLPELKKLFKNHD